MDIQALLQDFESVWINFCYREANRMADELACLGKDNVFLYEYYVQPPLLLLDVADDDMSGKKINRIIGDLCTRTIRLK